jgi:hypothetical protein
LIFAESLGLFTNSAIAFITSSFANAILYSILVFTSSFKSLTFLGLDGTIVLLINLAQGQGLLVFGLKSPHIIFIVLAGEYPT